MRAFTELLKADWAEQAGWTLLHSLWQIAVVAAIYAIAAFLLRGRSANSRYLLGCVAMLTMLGLPLGTYAFLPQAATFDVAEVSSEPVVAALPVESPESLPSEPSESLPVELSKVQDAPTQPMSDSGTLATVPSVVAAEQSTATDFLSEMRRYLPWATAVWMAGVLLLSLRPLFGWLHVNRLRRRGLSPLSESLLQVGRRVKERLGVRRVVALIESSLVEVPTVIGGLRPVILLPASALTGLSTAELELILAHELAHVKRHDWLVNLVQTVIEGLLFYHPAMWWVSHQIRKERENCCDDMVVDVGGSRAVYAKALARLEEQRSARPEAVLAATGGSLITRIRRLLGQPTKGCGYRHATAWLAGLVTIGFVVMVLAMNPPTGVAIAEAGEETEDDVASKIGFDTVFVSFNDPMAQREYITINADGSCVYKIDEVPARGQPEAWPSARQTFQLGKQRLRQLNDLLEKTGWFAVATGEISAPEDMSAAKITMERNGQTLSVTCHDLTPAPYASLLWFLRGVAHQENLLYKINNLSSKDSWFAWDKIGSDVRAKRGESGRALPIYDIDYNRYLSKCATVVRDPSAYHYEQVITAIRLIAFLRAQSEFDHIAAMSNDSNSSVRKAAARALVDIGGERALPLLAKMAGNTEEAIWGMIRLGDVAVPTLVEMIQKTDSNEDIRLSTRIVRAYMEHWNELPRPVDERVVAAARNVALPPKPDGQYHAAFLDLIDSRPVPAEGLSCRIDQQRVYCPKPMLFVHGWYMVVDGKIVQHVAAPTPPVDTTVFDLKYEVATDGGRPIFRVGWLPPPDPTGEQAQIVSRGTVIDVPKESHLEVVYDYQRDKPRMANYHSPLRVTGQYRTLWEGQFVKDGIALKPRIVYTARVVDPDERGWEFKPPSAPAVSMAAPAKPPRQVVFRGLDLTNAPEATDLAVLHDLEKARHSDSVRAEGGTPRYQAEAKVVYKSPSKNAPSQQLIVFHYPKQKTFFVWVEFKEIGNRVDTAVYGPFKGDPFDTLDLPAVDGPDDRQESTALSSLDILGSSYYSSDQIQITEATRTADGKVKITFRAMAETMYYCPGANGKTTDNGTELTFVRSFFKLKPKVEYPADFTPNAATRFIIVDAKNLPIFLKSGEELVQIFPPLGEKDTQFILGNGTTDGDAIAEATSRRDVRAVRTSNDRLSDESFATFAKWPDLYGVYMHNTTITGVGFAILAEHAQLRQVSLYGPNVNDDGLHAVSQLRHLTHLQFGNGWDNKDCTSEECKHRLHRAIITDRALSSVARMTKLAYLTIDNADITDDGIQQLGTLPSVEYILFLRCPKLTLQGVDRLRTALPKTRIINNEN